MITFRRTFCRHGLDESANPAVPENGVKVHFLGLFDTVNSVSTFDVGFVGTKRAPELLGNPEHVRHAGAIDERRVKFNAALCA